MKTAALQPRGYLPLLGYEHGAEAFHFGRMRCFEPYRDGITRRRPIPGKLVEARLGRNNFTQVCLRPSPLRFGSSFRFRRLPLSSLAVSSWPPLLPSALFVSP